MAFKPVKWLLQEEEWNLKNQTRKTCVKWKANNKKVKFIAISNKWNQKFWNLLVRLQRTNLERLREKSPFNRLVKKARLHMQLTKEVVLRQRPLLKIIQTQSRAKPRGQLRAVFRRVNAAVAQEHPITSRGLDEEFLLSTRMLHTGQKVQNVAHQNLTPKPNLKSSALGRDWEGLCEGRPLNTEIRRL